MRLRSRARVPQTVRGLMKPCVAAEPDEHLSAAADRMRGRRVGGLAVMEAGRLIGILTERDLLHALADGLNPRTTTVAACMTVGPRTIEPGAPAEEAAGRMIERGVRHLPVVEADRVVGMISARDLLVLGQRLALESLCYEPW
jgi:CBS domain-containing protein